MEVARLIPRVSILMGTYNGTQFLADQLDSIEAQEFTSWRLFVSDDGSTDGTLELLREYQRRWGDEKLVIINGPRKGFCHNFLSLASRPDIVSDFYAFCDQDDVWLPQKLGVAVDYLSVQDESIPQVYGGRTTYVDRRLKVIGTSQAFIYPRSFRNAIVQSIAGANTMVFNASAKALIQSIGPVNVISHDWWLYIITQGVGGQLYFDQQPYVLYRQHPGALIGANITLGGQLKRFILLLKGVYRRWNDQNTSVLLSVADRLQPQNLDILTEFARLRHSSIFHRLRMLSVCGLYRQGWHGGLCLFIAAIFKKL